MIDAKGKCATPEQREKEEEQRKEQNREYRAILNANRHLSIIDLM